jgi:hypothetical protein
VVEIGGDLVLHHRKRHRQIRVADEGRLSIHLSVESDRADPRALLGAQGFHGPDTAHRRFSAVHDGEATDGFAGAQAPVLLSCGAQET